VNQRKNTEKKKTAEKQMKKTEPYKKGIKENQENKNGKKKRRFPHKIILIVSIVLVVLGLVGALIKGKKENKKNDSSQSADADTRAEFEIATWQDAEEAGGKVSAARNNLISLIDQLETTDVTSVSYMEDMFDTLDVKYSSMTDLPENLKKAGDDYFIICRNEVTLLMDLYTSMYGVQSTKSEAEKLLTTGSDDPEEFEEKYSKELELVSDYAYGIVCRSYLSEPQKQILELVDALQKDMDDFHQAVEQDDSAKQEEIRLLIMRDQDNLIKHLQAFDETITKTYAEEYMNHLVSVSKMISEEIRGTASLAEEEISKYKFQYDLSGVYVMTEAAETIDPAQYETGDPVLILRVASLGEERNVTVTCEIPGFTEKDTKTIAVSGDLLTCFIKPAMLSGADVSKEKDAEMQLNILSEDGSETFYTENFPVHIDKQN